MCTSLIIPALFEQQSQYYLFISNIEFNLLDNPFHAIHRIVSEPSEHREAFVRQPHQRFFDSHR